MALLVSVVEVKSYSGARRKSSLRSLRRERSPTSIGVITDRKFVVQSMIRYSTVMTVKLVEVSGF